MAQKRPGVMLYFSVRPSFKYLSYEQMGRLYEAILDYGEYGTQPDFDDPLLGMAWSFVVTGIDRDWDAYLEKDEKRKYAAYCREAQKNENDAISFEDWKALSEEERKKLLT